MREIRRLAARFKRGGDSRESESEASDLTHTPADVSADPDEGGIGVDKYIQARPHNHNMDPAVQRRIDSDLRELDRAREVLRGMRRAAVEQKAVADRVGGHTARTSDRKRQSELYARAYDCAQRREKTKPKKKKSRKGKKGKKKKKKQKHTSSSGSNSSASGSDLSSGGVFRKAWGANSTSAVQLARRSPGTLSKIFVRTLQKMIRGRGHVSEPGGANFEAIVTTYVRHDTSDPEQLDSEAEHQGAPDSGNRVGSLFWGKSRKHAMCSASASKQSSPPL